MPSITGKYYLSYYMGILLLAAMTFVLVIPATKAKNSIPETQKKIVVIDPGHGGYDTGAQGPDGTYEKTVAMTLARMIASELKDKYHVVFTRSDDYWIDIADRTAVANHLKADIFLSIHTGGSFRHKANGVTFFHFKNAQEVTALWDISGTKLTSGIIARTSWDNIQNEHIKASRVLAETLQQHLLEHTKYLDGAIDKASLLVLAGADMPAVLLEAGYLTNPSDEKKLNDEKFLSGFSKGISQGIINFFQK